MNKINEWILSLTPVEIFGYATCLAAVITIIGLTIYFFRRKQQKKQLFGLRKDIVEKMNEVIESQQMIEAGTITAGTITVYYQQVQKKQSPKFWKLIFDTIKYPFVKIGQLFKFLFSRKKEQNVEAQNADTRLSTTVIAPQQSKNPVKRFFGWCWKNIKTFFNWCRTIITRFGSWCLRTVKNIMRWCVRKVTGILAWLWKAIKWVFEYTAIATGTLLAILLILGFLYVLYLYNTLLGITAAILLLVTLYLFRKKIWEEITGKNIVEDEVEEYQEPGTSFFKRRWVRLVLGTIIATMIIGAIIFSSALIDSNQKSDNGKEQAEKVEPKPVGPKPLPGGGGKVVTIDHTWNAGRGSLTIPPGKEVRIGIQHGAIGHMTTNGAVKRCNLAGTDCIEEIPVTLNRIDTIILSPDKIPFLLTNTGSSDVTISYYLHL